MAELPRLNQYEWFGIGKYLAYLERKLALIPIDINDIWSVRVTSSYTKLLKKKIRTRDKIIRNEEALLSFQEINDLDANEQGVIATLSGNYAFYIEILDEQIVMLDELTKTSQLQLFYEPLDEDEIPF